MWRGWHRRKGERVDHSDHGDVVDEVEEFLAAGGDEPDLAVLLDEFRQALDEDDYVQAAAWLDTLTERERLALQENLRGQSGGFVYAAVAMVAAWQKFIQAVDETVQQVVEVMVEAAQPVMAQVRQLTDRYAERCRRQALTYRLRRWPLPERVAVLVARVWPKRWLPRLAYGDGVPFGERIF